MDPINEADVEPERTDRGDASFERRRLADAAGGEALGCSHYRLPPGGTGERDVHGYYRRDETVGYWGDEDDA